MKYIKNRKGPFPNNDNVKWETLDGKDAVVWDSWIAGQDDHGNYVLYAMTDSGPGLEKRIKVEGQHHVAFLTAWKTNDFTQFEQVNQEVLFSNPDGPDNACIWSGSVIKTKVPDADGKKYVQGYALFYTSRTIIGAGPTDRNTELDQGFQIAIVRGDHLNGDEKWERIEGFRMVADPEIHELMTDYSEGYEYYGKRVCYKPKSPSAFRDPYPFFINEGNKKEVYVAVSTKKKFCPAENREMINNNGSITFYHVVDGDLANLNAYEYIDQFTPVEDGSAGYQEMECPHVYYSNEEGCLLLIYSTSGRPTRAKNCKTKPGQLHAVRFRISNGHFEKIGEIKSLLGKKSHIYGAYMTPPVNIYPPSYIGFRNYIKLKDDKADAIYEMCGGFGTMGKVPNKWRAYREDRDLYDCSKAAYQTDEQISRSESMRIDKVRQQHIDGKTRTKQLRRYATTVLKENGKIPLTPRQRYLIERGNAIEVVVRINDEQKKELDEFDSEALTAAAWDALEKQPAVAIDNAKKCIDLFETTATEQQAKLTSAPPDGAVSKDQKKAIFANWALNDVGTCYWIMGQALEKLNRANDAKEAYKGAQKFPYARTWDSQGWFWQPAKAASERLAKMP